MKNEVKKIIECCEQQVSNQAFSLGEIGTKNNNIWMTKKLKLKLLPIICNEFHVEDTDNTEYLEEEEFIVDEWRVLKTKWRFL